MVLISSSTKKACLGNLYLLTENIKKCFLFQIFDRMSQYGRGYYTSSSSSYSASSSVQKPVAAPFYNFGNGNDDFEYDTSDSNQYSSNSCGYKRSSFDDDRDLNNGNCSKRLRTENNGYHGYSSGSYSYSNSYNITSDHSNWKTKVGYRDESQNANQNKYSFSYSDRSNLTNLSTTSTVPSRVIESTPASCPASVQPPSSSSSSPPSTSSGFRVSPELSMPVFQTLDRSDSWTNQMTRQAIRKNTIVDSITSR